MIVIVFIFRLKFIEVHCENLNQEIKLYAEVV